MLAYFFFFHLFSFRLCVGLRKYHLLPSVPFTAKLKNLLIFFSFFFSVLLPRLTRLFRNEKIYNEFFDWVQRSFQTNTKNYPWTFHVKRFFSVLYSAFVSLLLLFPFCSAVYLLICGCVYVCMPLYTTIDCCSIVIMKIGLWEQLIQYIIWREFIFRSGHHPHANFIQFSIRISFILHLISIFIAFIV